MSDKKLSYNELKTQLDEILEKLQDPMTEIDEALELHKQGKVVITKLESYLKEVELRIQKATT
jgi:exodeoxyribonuclease VII small subunit